MVILEEKMQQTLYFPELYVLKDDKKYVCQRKI